MRAPWLVCVLTLSACVSSGRVHQLETRMAAAEAAQAKGEFELRAALARVEAMLEAMAGTVRDATEVAERSAALEDQLDELSKQLAARPVAPPAPPARRGPDPDQTYGVPVTGYPVRGKATALVTIVRAGEYACPFCEKVRPTLDQIATTYGDKVRIVYRQYVVHPQVATYPAQAACAAHRQGKFWDMDKLLWDETFAKREFEPAQVDALAVRIGLDMRRYAADVGPCLTDVTRDQTELTKFGVGATPAFFINGRFLSGAQPFPAFAALIDEELVKAQAAVKRGVKPAKFYEQEIVKKGLPKL
ncbi:MAG: DsbA family protein [Myxococcales bacterium]|nr:DsbA family protein [Myxococcales bacterium]